MPNCTSSTPATGPEVLAAIPGGLAGETSRCLYATADLTIGRYVVRAWSPIWDGPRETWPFPVLSFPYEPYRVEVSEWGDEAASQNEVLLINPRQQFRRRPEFRRKTCNDWIWYSPALLRDAVKDLDPEASERPTSPFRDMDAPLEPTVFALQRLLVGYVGALRHPDPLLVEEAAVRILAGALAGSASVRGRKPGPKRRDTLTFHRKVTSEAKAYMLENYRSPICLGDIGRAVGTSLSHLSDIFLRESGRTVYAYVTDLRLKEAFRRLPDYRGRLTELALDLGFSDGNHLSHAFRCAFGAPPTRVALTRGATDEAALRSALERIDRPEASPQIPTIT